MRTHPASAIEAAKSADGDRSPKTRMPSASVSKKSSGGSAFPATSDAIQPNPSSAAKNAHRSAAEESFILRRADPQNAATISAKKIGAESIAAPQGKRFAAIAPRA